MIGLLTIMSLARLQSVVCPAKRRRKIHSV